jgi:thiamine-monophosphate kinase
VGWAAAGLAVLLHGDATGGRGPSTASIEAVLDAHRVPHPPYAAGPAAARAGATAMIDISDGLLSDLAHVAESSGVRIDVRSDALPVPAVLAEVAAALGADPVRWLLTGGEDHALAATFPPGTELPHGWTPIGTVHHGNGEGGGDSSSSSGGGGVSVDGEAYAGIQGWDHFTG